MKSFNSFRAGVNNILEKSMHLVTQHHKSDGHVVWGSGASKNKATAKAHKLAGDWAKDHTKNRLSKHVKHEMPSSGESHAQAIERSKRNSAAQANRDSAVTNRYKSKLKAGMKHYVTDKETHRSIMQDHGGKINSKVHKIEGNRVSMR